MIKKGADIHAYDDYALIWASYNGHNDIVKLLMKEVANIHADDDGALRYAIKNGHTETVKLLKSYY